jgi:hypothetical protein
MATSLGDAMAQAEALIGVARHSGHDKRRWRRAIAACNKIRDPYLKAPLLLPPNIYLLPYQCNALNEEVTRLARQIDHDGLRAYSLIDAAVSGSCDQKRQLIAAVEILDRIGDEAGLAIALEFLAACCEYRDEPDEPRSSEQAEQAINEESIKHVSRSLEMLRRIGCVRNILGQLWYLGLLYRRQKDFVNAKECILAYLEMAVNTNRPQHAIEALIVLVNDCRGQKSEMSAREFAATALKIANDSASESEVQVF